MIELLKFAIIMVLSNEEYFANCGHEKYTISEY